MEVLLWKKKKRNVAAMKHVNVDVKKEKSVLVKDIVIVMMSVAVEMVVIVVMNVIVKMKNIIVVDFVMRKSNLLFLL